MLRRIGAYYGKAHLQALLKKIKRVTDPAKRKELIERLLAPYRKRMNDLSIFMKEVKGGFARWYNKVYKRYGVLWAERFKSVLLEAGNALATVAAYIDLNPVRAGLCTDPKDYPYCGYAEALARGSPEDQENLRIILDLLETSSWEELCREYRKHLFMRGALANKNHPARSESKGSAIHGGGQCRCLHLLALIIGSEPMRVDAYDLRPVCRPLRVPYLQN